VQGACGSAAIELTMGIVIKSPREITIMREAGRIVAIILQRLAEEAKPGVTTAELDALCVEELAKHGAKASFKGYHGFPAHICTSVNEEVVHGIPDERVLKDGDILSLDAGTIFQGLQGDSAITVGVGEVSDKAQELMEATRGALHAGIEVAKPGGYLGDISAAIQHYAESRGFSVVRQYSGHGIGYQMHEDPSIPNFGEPGEGPVLKEGMTLALEPMLNVGGWETVVKDNQWTVVTADGSLSAHFEHTIAISDDGAEILTRL
jgi:methionyl aminopeptidase